MSAPVEAVGFLPPLQPIKIDGDLSAGAAGAASSDFGAWLDQELSRANGKLVDADRQLQQLAAGATDNLHQVMLAMEDAKLSFQLLLQVRNHVLDAYQDLLRTQV